MKMKAIINKFLTTVIFLCLPYFAVANQQNNQNSIEITLESIERTHQGRIGVYALNTENNQVIQYRAKERWGWL